MNDMISQNIGVRKIVNFSKDIENILLFIEHMTENVSGEDSGELCILSIQYNVCNMRNIGNINLN